jgi:hypothetical protein
MKVDLEKEDIYSEPPIEGGPKIAKLLEDHVDSYESLNGNLRLVLLTQVSK